MQRKKSVFVGIPAHNEENNIGALLQSILDQKGQRFVIDAIVIACDGCTDKTTEIVRKLGQKSKLIKVIDDGRRLGKVARLKAFYRSMQSDLFVTFDADVRLGHEYIVEELVRAFRDKRVGLVAGRVTPAPQHTLVGRALNAYERCWERIVSTINNGRNVHAHVGPVSAARRAFVKNVTIPTDIVAEDHFLYFEARRAGYLFVRVPHAFVYFKVPADMNGFLNQTSRFFASADKIRSHFGGWVDQEYRIPVHVKLSAYLATFVEQPAYLMIALLLQLIQRVAATRVAVKGNTGVWDTIKSSK